MNHKKCLYSMLTLGLTAAIAYAAAPLSKPPKERRDLSSITGVSAKEAALIGSGSQNISIPPQTQFNPTLVFGTDFETGDGWDLNASRCGAEFAICPGPTCEGGPNHLLPCLVAADCPAPGACTQRLTDQCSAKDHAVSQNCCRYDQNEDTGWYCPDGDRHCDEPSIRDLHPSSGTQHIRFQYEADAGNPVGCQGTGPACRERLNSSIEKPQFTITKQVYSYELAFSQTVAQGNRSLVEVFGGFEGHPFIFSTTDTIFSAAGYVIAHRSLGGGVFQDTTVGAWKFDSPDYGKMTITYDPCNSKVEYKYEGKPNLFFPGKCSISQAPCGAGGLPACPAGETCDGGGVGTLSYDSHFSPPYGDVYYDNASPTQDQMIWLNNHQNDGTKVDLDDFSITHTECPDACCNANNSGLCNDDGVEFPDQASCEAAGGRYYPNTQCAQLGTPSYPPACGKDRGSCCDAGPRSGGTCTDGVLEADCVGAQLTWTKGATCDQEGYSTLCDIGYGGCSCTGNLTAGLLTPCPGLCTNPPTDRTCSTYADCQVEGFCFNGLCAQAVCSGAAGANTPCSSNADCTAPATCTAYVCNGNADCPGVSGPCVVPAVSPGGRLCTSDAQCTVPAAPVCEEHKGACCEYVKGTCADDVLEEDCKGAQETWFKLERCADVEARGGCEAHLGACCDEDPFGGCTQTTENACAATPGGKGVFYKLQDCSEITCVHNAIPTVSEWGIVVLTLLLLTGAKVYFGRRQAAAA